MASKRKPMSLATPSPAPLPALPAAALPPQHSRSAKLFGALFYAGASFLIMMVNKYALYTWRFPSVGALALAQFVFTLVALRTCKSLGLVSFPDTTASSVRAVFPLPLLFVGNAVSGLFGTKMLSLPMFTVLRRTNMLFTMVLETYVLHAQYSQRIKLSIFFMLFGSVLAALLDMQFDFWGYTATFSNNVFTSINGVVLKLKLNKLDQADADKRALQNVWGLMYLNSLCGTPLLLASLLLAYPETLHQAWAYEYWGDWQFQLLFLLSAGMGTVLQFSIFYCTRVNSALTTVVTGVLKNVVTSYAGILDVRLGYTFHWLNFVGMNVSMLGGIAYAYLQFVESTAQQQQQQPASLSAPPATTTTAAQTDSQTDLERQENEPLKSVH